MFAFSAFQSVNSLSVDIVPFVETLKGAAIVARIKLTEEKIQVVEKNEGFTVCGYMYKAKVLESFKGESNNFSFFSPYEVDITKHESEYLIVTYKLSHNGNNSCIPKNSSYFVKKIPQSLYKFDHLASKKYKGNWLRIERFNSIGDDGVKLKTVKSNCEEKYYVMSWLDIKNLILSFLDKQ